MDSEECRILSILEAIVQHLDSSEMKQRLSRCSATYLKSWKDENSMDLVHHCVLENNIVALMLLLTRGYFKSPHEPKTWPYLHLVACLGRRTFISSIIQEIKYQNDAVTLNWDVLIKVVKPSIKESFPEIKPTDREKKMSPIDVAAFFGHIGCVRLLLDFWQVHKPSMFNQRSKQHCSLYLSLACQAHSPIALQLLLHEHSDKMEALEYALQMLSPECVDIVLQHGSSTDLQKAFNGMNLYHVLYTYNSCLTSEQYKAMVEITSVLIKHKQDVNVLLPSRTFPLYSLLNHSMAGTTVEECGSSLLACLLLLLEAGADPNVDEILMEEKVQNSELNSAFGRRPHSSAINCFLGNVPLLKFNTPENPVLNHIDNYAHKVIELLLQHGANMGFTGSFHKTAASYESQTMEYHTGTALHLMLSTRSQSLLSYSLVRLILHSGIDADTRGDWSMPDLPFSLEYAINILPFSLWLSQDPKEVFTSKDLEIFTYIVKFMSQTALRLAYSEFLHAIHVSRLLPITLGAIHILLKVQECAFFEDIVNKFEEGTNHPWLLQRCCSHVIWRACRMCVGYVNELPIPGPLKNVVINFH